MSMTATQVKDLITTLWTRVGSNRVGDEDLRTVGNAIVDLVAATDTDIFPDWAIDLTFQTDGTDDGQYCKHPDTNGKKRIFETKTDDNTGNEPPTDPLIVENASWKEISQSAKSGINEWSAGVYGEGLVVVAWNHSTEGYNNYVLTEPVRPFTSVDIEAEITAGKWVEFGKQARDQAIAEAMTGLWDDRGNFDASVDDMFPAAGGSGAAGAILKGDIWTVSVAGTIDGEVVNVGDTVRAIADAPGQDPANWAVGESNIGYVPENQANKATDFSTVNNTLYPTVQAVYDNIWKLTGTTTLSGASTVIIPSNNSSAFRFQFTGPTGNDTYFMNFDTRDDAGVTYQPVITFGRTPNPPPPFGSPLLLKYSHQPSGLLFDDLAIPTKKYVDDLALVAGSGVRSDLTPGVLDWGGTVTYNTTLEPDVLNTQSIQFGTYSSKAFLNVFTASERIHFYINPHDTSVSTSADHFVIYGGSSLDALFEIDQATDVRMTFDDASGLFIRARNDLDQYIQFDPAAESYYMYIKESAGSNYTEYAADVNSHTWSVNGTPKFEVTINSSEVFNSLRLRAGTATAGTAPAYLQSGTALTTPADGALEYHSSHLYFTIGSTRYQLDQQGGGSGWATASTTSLTGDVIIDELATGGTPYTLTFKADNLANTVTNGRGIWLSNSTAASSAVAGDQQWSPSLVFHGAGWSTTGGASVDTKWAISNQPSSGSTTAQSTLAFQISKDGSAYANGMTLNSNQFGTITLTVGNGGVGTLAVQNITGLFSASINKTNAGNSTTALHVTSAYGTASSNISIRNTAGFIASSGSNPFFAYLMDGTINQTGTSSSALVLHSLNPTLTAVLGNLTAFHYGAVTMSGTGYHLGLHLEAGGVAVNGTLTPAQITANVDDYSPTGFKQNFAIRIFSDASRNITGMVKAVDGEMKLLFNYGTQDIVLKDEDANSSAANRFALNADITIAPDESVLLWYDGNSDRWRAVKT